jgi:hypothetical protein
MVGERVFRFSTSNMAGARPAMHDLVEAGDAYFIAS